MKHEVKKEHITFFILYLLSSFFVVIVLIFHVTFFVFIKKYLTEAKKQTPKTEEQQKPFFNKVAFSDIVIEGKAYVVYDLSMQEIIAAHNEMTPLPLASITKVMTAISATKHNPKDGKLVISEKSIEDGYDLGLKNGQVWTLKELLKYVLVFSSNDGAEVVADTFGGSDSFLKQMNDDAKNFGLSFVFTDPAGRDMHGKLGGQGNAFDVARLFGIARKEIPEIMDATTKKRQTVTAGSGKISGIPNTNQAIETLSGAEASKTGFTDLAGGNLGVIVDITVGRPVVIVVLGSTREGRFRDIDKLYSALRKSIILQ